jgi:hypothetical protein
MARFFSLFTDMFADLHALTIFGILPSYSSLKFLDNLLCRMENNVFWMNMQAVADTMMNHVRAEQRSIPMNLNLHAVADRIMNHARAEQPSAPLNLNLQAMTDMMMNHTRAEQPSAPINLNLLAVTDSMMNHARAEQLSAPINLNEDVGDPSEPQGAAIQNRPAQSTPTKTKLQNFSPDEDRALVISWIAISTDPIVSTGQKKEAFWQQVTNACNNKRRMAPERTQKSVRSRWEAIKEQTMKFSSIFRAVHRENPSGMSGADKVNQPNRLLFSCNIYSFIHFLAIILLSLHYCLI